ncbi:phosphotransferase family protein [Actinomadura parmotrematis]|uniref:Phosphotransferase family protein n=1 Tax=Actinomadura parmotrematis TaxID=2864039 RepID=A0ABS7FWK4_9ACTN|nr:phosphotransferase family protein [Actinomadura parmotrematis]MBW8484803.1 phosphotransferase family protein [Actinomadura parmotrematis]
MTSGSERVRDVRAEDAFDVAAVHEWLALHMPGYRGAFAAPPRVRQFAGGASNLTYLLSPPDGASPGVVLRRPPRGTRAASAHDMGREVLVQRRLRPHLDVVPRVHAFCEDETVIGAPFYVMEHLRGTVLGAEPPAGADLGEAAARALGETVIDTLADLHSVDVAAAGLEPLGRGPGYVRRQVSGWSRRWTGAATPDAPDAAALLAWLDERRPGDVAARLLHGDWKLDNLVVDLAGAAPRIVGVLDWEMATVGDPLMDLGAAMAYWITADDDPDYTVLRRQPTHLPGMPTRERAVARYLDRTGLPVDDWRFYEVFGLFRLAVIVQQIWARYTAGQTTDPQFAAFGSLVAMLIARAARRAGVG